MSEMFGISVQDFPLPPCFPNKNIARKKTPPSAFSLILIGSGCCKKTRERDECSGSLVIRSFHALHGRCALLRRCLSNGFQILRRLLRQRDVSQDSV